MAESVATGHLAALTQPLPHRRASGPRTRRIMAFVLPAGALAPRSASLHTAGWQGSSRSCMSLATRAAAHHLDGASWPGEGMLADETPRPRRPPPPSMLLGSGSCRRPRFANPSTDHHTDCIARAARPVARRGWHCMPRAVSTHNASAATRGAEFSSTIYNELTLFILQLVSRLMGATAAPGVRLQCTFNASTAMV